MKDATKLDLCWSEHQDNFNPYIHERCDKHVQHELMYIGVYKIENAEDQTSYDNGLLPL
ncbi:hypothetical protein [Peribacillus butanolivorans]